MLFIAILYCHLNISPCCHLRLTVTNSLFPSSLHVTKSSPLPSPLTLLILSPPPCFDLFLRTQLLFQPIFKFFRYSSFFLVMDQPSEKKSRKLPKDAEPKKRSASSSNKQEHSHLASSSLSSHPNKLSDPGTQRKHHWQTVLQPSPPTSTSPTHSLSNSRNIPPNPKQSLTAPSAQNMTSDSSSNGRRHQPSSRTPLQPVPIAPKGPLLKRREDNDGYRFECPEEGCRQKFRHRSSRSRHKKKCPMKRRHEKS